MSRINFDLQQLQAFVAVADRAGFRAAAEDLHLSPAALSRRIDRLEQLLGARLFERTTRAVQLTRAGEAFLPRARLALDDLEAAVLGIHEIAARHAGRVSVACIPTIATTRMPGAIDGFSRRMPLVKVRLMDGGMDEVAAAVRTGEADFGLGFSGVSDPGLAFEPLVEDHYVLAIRRDHPLARKRAPTLALFAQERWLAVARTSGNRRLLDAALDVTGRPPVAWLEVGHVSTLLAMVEAGLGVGLVPALAVPQRHPVLKGLRLDDVGLRRHLGVLSLAEGQLTPLARRFLDHLRQSW
ncbi:LysR family transcriptional regulator [uncultured Pseudacidovorax sp.]|uniref:LysR family transcriptional regulator n=1 Tax=uncultured Pseudacidovorax sp. TaxID=679313 RepID=UPI0025E8016B|nr:LysR family transcriptional regulator [uncultured Pseudacidovorax sp.]